MLGALKVFVASLLIGVSSFFGARTSITPSPIPTPFIDDYKLLSMVNDYRSSNKLSTYTTDYEVCSIGQRIIDTTFWQTDISLNNYKDICPTCSSLSIAESQNQYNLGSILSEWEASKTTLNTIQGNYKYGCAKVKNDKVVFVTATKSSVAKNTTAIINTDPIVTCNIHANCGGGSKQLKKSVCDNMTCCNFDQKCGGSQFVTKAECNNNYCCLFSDGTGRLLTSKSACDNYSTNNNQGSTYTTPSYPPCTVYYPALGYSQTYNYTSPETCKIWQDQANIGNTKINIPTIQPLPMLAPIPTYRDYNDPVCQSTRNDWDLIKAKIGPLDGSNQNYSNSADLMRDYLYWRDQINTKYKANMCTGYLQ